MISKLRALSFITIAGSLVAISSCTTAPIIVAKFCESDAYLIDALYDGGNFYRCSASPDNTVRMDIYPEDEPPINPSPWYSFRISPRQQADVRITINFHDAYARYWPKTSIDKENWEPMPETDVARSTDGKTMTLSLRIDDRAIYVSGQELVLADYYYSWIQTLADRNDVSTKMLGRSVQGRPIFVAATDPKPESILLVGRQHPPEITGGLAMRRFVDTVLGETDLAIKFRDRFSVIVIPLINPDGVVLGHWRHNVNGVDLNRDWGPFTQPETRGVANYLAGPDGLGDTLHLMLDFHSTRINTFYTQMPEESNLPFDFATVWLQRASSRVPKFEFKHDARPHSGQANTKNYFYDTYGIPAITYELGDETERHIIDQTTPIFAEEMMRTLLELP